MADEYSSTTAAEDDKDVVVISDSEGEEEDNGIVEFFYDGSPHITLPPEVWAAVINCEYHICFVYRSYIYVDTEPSFL